MAGDQRCKNKSCNAPLLSTFEKNAGKCTACLKAERMKVAANIISNVKTAKIKTPSRIQASEPACIPGAERTVEVEEPPSPDVVEYTKDEHECIPELDSENANSVLVSFRVSPSTERVLNHVVKTANTTKAAYLRAMLEDSLVKDL